MQQFLWQKQQVGIHFLPFCHLLFWEWDIFFSIHWQQTKQTKVAAEAQAHALSAQATSDMMCAEGN